MLTLIVGTPAIIFIGAAGAAVAVALPRGGVLVSVLVLPLAIPVLIFGVAASYAAVNEPDPFLPPFLILAALTLFLAVIGPAAAAIALRFPADEVEAPPLPPAAASPISSGPQEKVMSAHALYVTAAYLVSALVLAGLVGWIFADQRARLRELADLDAAGMRRRSDRGGTK